MQKRISTLPFQGTKEQQEQLFKVIDENGGTQGSVMPILQKAQEIYGYLPIEVQTMIAEKMDIPLEEIYGVSTFYSLFALTPKGKYDISVCMGTACYVKGAADVLDKICEVLGIQPEECTQDGKFSITECRCIGACGLAPVMTVNDDVYGRVSVSEVEDILSKYE
ncbi:MAG: NAD(P)H-dependent oxidoreductase subunit E [Acutalibacteraceae bacterium]|nr:NAD(P)H-dependent oxidoreductase subunit E [Acutalibacteraceae bacterium]